MTVNLSDLSCSALIFLTSSLEAMSLSKVLVACQGHVVQVVAAVIEFYWEFEFSVLALCYHNHECFKCNGVLIISKA